jgi:hypothetical protein
MVGRLAVLVLVALTLVGSRQAVAEVIELNGGDWVEGRLKEVTPSSVVVEVGGQTITFPSDRVAAIYFRGSTPGPPAPPAGPPSPAPLAAPPVAAPSAPTGTTAPAPAALPARSSAATVYKSPSPTADALQVVRSLRSAVLGGMNFREYQSKVSAAATIVDRYLAALPEGPESQSIHDAVRYYVLAESAWNNQGAASRTVWLRKVDALNRCTAYQDFAKTMQSKGDAYYAERVKNYVVISDGVISVLWSCASEKIAEAETLLANAGQ